jgi:hypothetical protein
MRLPGKTADDYEVLDSNRRVVGRIMRHPQASEDCPWFWTITARVTIMDIQQHADRRRRILRRGGRRALIDASITYRACSDYLGQVVNNVVNEPNYPAGVLRAHEGNFRAARPNKTSRPRCWPRHQRRRQYDLPMW